MNWDVLKLLYIHEIKMLVRARRTVVMAIVIPAIIMPIMLFSARFSNEQRQRALEATTYNYAVTGQLADRVRELITSAKAEIDKDERESNDQLRKFKFIESPTSDPAASLERRDIYFYIATYTGEEADALPVTKADDESDDSPAVAALQPPKRLPGVPIIKVVYRGNNDASNSSSRRMVSLLRSGVRNDSERLLIERGFEGNPKGMFAVVETSIATAGQKTGANVGRFLTVILVMLMLTGGSIAAMDIIAGEKERGTIETLLTTAAARHEIVTAKQLAICSVALIITLIQGLNFFIYVKLQLVQLPKDFALQISTTSAITLLMLFIPLAATIAALLLTLSAYAKTYKEAQMYFFPVYLTSLVPALASVLPALRLRSAIVLVPLANVSVAVREIMMNRPDRPMIAVTFLVMTLCAALLMRASARMLSREEVIIASHGEPESFLGGPVLFQKRVLRWFAVMWAIVFAVAANIPQLATFRRQLLFNEFAIFGGGTVLMLWVYRLRLKEALALRSVKWPVWIAILIAAPTGNLMGVAVFKLLNYVIPIPEQAVEQMAALMPQDLPSWQLYLFLGLIPGVVEELAFRGVLLHGLRRKIRPVLLPLVVGLIFGLFHFSLFRIGPTAFLGVLLTAIAMLTGSVFPGMLLHILNNSFAAWTAQNGWSVTSLEPGHDVAATIIFALAMWIIYRNRTPYPLN